MPVVTADRNAAVPIVRRIAYGLLAVVATLVLTVTLTLGLYTPDEGRDDGLLPLAVLPAGVVVETTRSVS